MSSTYVTVAIPYVNANPHLGYAYELVLADTYARSRRTSGDRVRFLGGTDDYSLKNVLAAEAAGESTSLFVAKRAEQFAALAAPLGLSFDDFIRTSTDPRHAPAVERLWRAALAAGDLYRRHYEGDYCVGCEQFYEPADQLDGCCPEHGTPTETVVEENWFFRLSRYQHHLEALITSEELVIRPEPFRREALAFVRSGLHDISVSRSVERARGWGIPVPDDPSQVVYVWFDALTNYISALGFGDGESREYRTWWLRGEDRVHVIGKGIVRFHAIYWPAFLASAGQPAPTRIQVHPYLTVDGRKLSKSAGASAHPAHVAAAQGVDALRWFFAREISDVADTDFTEARLIARANEDLASGLGNVTHRVVTLVHRYAGGRVVAGIDPLPAVAPIIQAVAAAIGDFQLREACRLLIDAVAAVNRELESEQPWMIARDPSRGDELAVLLSRHVTTLRRVAAAVQPIVPSLGGRLGQQVSPDPETGRLPPPAPVFRRIE